MAVVLWLAYLYQSTGHIFGNAEFTHYNVGFQLHPMRLGVTLIRRVYYSVRCELAHRRDRCNRSGMEANGDLPNRDWGVSRGRCFCSDAGGKQSRGAQRWSGI